MVGSTPATSVTCRDDQSSRCLRRDRTPGPCSQNPGGLGNRSLHPVDRVVHHSSLGCDPEQDAEDDERQRQRPRSTVGVTIAPPCKPSRIASSNTAPAPTNCRSTRRRGRSSLSAAAVRPRPGHRWRSCATSIAPFPSPTKCRRRWRLRRLEPSPMVIIPAIRNGTAAKVISRAPMASASRPPICMRGWLRRRAEEHDRYLRCVDAELVTQRRECSRRSRRSQRR